MPGSGFLPKILAVLTILFGLALMLRAGESKPFATLRGATPSTPPWWSRSRRSAIARFDWLGFHHHQHPDDVRAAGHHRAAKLPAGAPSTASAVVVVTYVLFVYVLKTPLETGPFGF